MPVFRYYVLVLLARWSIGYSTRLSYGLAAVAPNGMIDSIINYIPRVKFIVLVKSLL